MTKRERQWSRTRQVEWLYILVAVIATLFAIRTVKDQAVLVAGAVVLMLLGQAIWIWQYRVLDELGKLRFLKAFTVFGMALCNGMLMVMLWAMFQSPQRLSPEGIIEPPSIPFWPFYWVVVLSLVGMGLTNLYLRWREGR